MSHPLGKPRFALTAALLAVTLAACSKCSEPAVSRPPAPHLAQVPDGLGSLYAESRILRVRDRKLVLPDGRTCTAEAPECVEALVALRGQALALDLESSLLMADLSEPLAALSHALEPGDEACLMVGDSRSLRCLRFRPFSGGEFAAWLDAPRPLGKIRVVMRSDGIEVVADRGKVPGPDRYGPTLPPKQGKPDFEGLEPIMRQMAVRFSHEDEAGVVPSGLMTVEHVARALACLSGRDSERFTELFLVYP